MDLRALVPKQVRTQSSEFARTSYTVQGKLSSSLLSRKPKAWQLLSNKSGICLIVNSTLRNSTKLASKRLFSKNKSKSGSVRVPRTLKHAKKHHRALLSNCSAMQVSGTPLTPARILPEWIRALPLESMQLPPNNRLLNRIRTSPKEPLTPLIVVTVNKRRT